MVDGTPHQKVGATGHTQVNWLGRLWPWSIVSVMLLVSSGLLPGGTGAAERALPVRIGVLTDSWGPTPQVAGLRNGLLELGYREHEDFVLGVRFTQGDVTALSTAARQLVQYGVDLIFAALANAARAAQSATTRIPIVFVNVGDPVGLGLVESFARPGSNITGVTALRHGLSPKRLELFREIVPGLKRVLYLYNVNDAVAVTEVKKSRDAARRLGIALVEQAVRTEQEAQAILTEIRTGKVDGIFSPSSVSLNIPGFILDATSQGALPTMFHTGFFVERGGLASYGTDLYETGRQAARLVDKIFKGVDPAEIPVEVNPKLEFVINLEVAHALGLIIPPEVLYQADKLVR